MVNYENSKVYKIWSPCGDNIYVGSTTKHLLCQRMDKHRYDYKYWKNGKPSYISSFQLFEDYGIENCFIELLEAKVCINKDELKQLEGKYIRELTCVNKYIAGQTIKEWRHSNKEQIKEYNKKWNGTNKERLHTIINCECGGKTTYADKSHHYKTKKHLEFINKNI